MRLNLHQVKMRLIISQNIMKNRENSKNGFDLIPFLEGRLALIILASSSASCCVGCMHCTYVINGPRPLST